jgi:CO/xanthine dehydrogenase Mo-binding subunit
VGVLQVTGEARYCDDEPAPPGCLEAALVLSSEPFGRIVSVDISRALAVPGVVDVIRAGDVPGVVPFRLPPSSLPGVHCRLGGKWVLGGWGQWAAGIEGGRGWEGRGGVREVSMCMCMCMCMYLCILHVYACVL